MTHVVDPGLLKKELCAETGRLTRDEWRRHVGKYEGMEYQETC